MKVIVFGNDHTNSLGVIQSLGLAGYQSIGLIFGEKTGFIYSSSFTSNIITAKDAQCCIEKLIESDLGYEFPLPIIACCDSAALALEKNSDKLKSRFLYEYSTNYSLEYVSKKENQVKIALESGFDVPKSWCLKDFSMIPSDITYPCIIKPLVSCQGAKCDIRVCRTRNALEKNLKTLNYTKEVLIQQYIERDYELCIIGCSTKKGDCIIPAKETKLSIYPKNVGLVCVADIQPFDNNTIRLSIENIVRKIGYVGLFSVELMHCKDDGKFYFTEINLRNDGGQGFITKYGANLPQNHIEDLYNHTLTEQKECNPGIYIWEMHHFLSLVHREVRLTKWLSDIRCSLGFITYFKEDKKPFFKQYTNWILSKLHLRKNESYS